jgi:putative OPT family oligopeptide transporter
MAAFHPYVPSTVKPKEFTIRALILGILLGIVFGVGNTYLGLKTGTTVSASIPAAVLSMSILRLFFKRVSILENNLVQTIASVGEGVAGGLIFTAPALFLLGEQVPISRLFLLATLGGILGVLFMIPMRRYIIVEEHGKLPFPEGTACAEILKSGEKGLSQASYAFYGILAGIAYKILSGVLHLWNEVVSWTVPRFQKTAFSVDCTPALLGVGYIIGPRISSLLFFGGMLGWWVIIPLIKEFGSGAIYPGTIPIAQMSANDIWSNYVRYIGAGAVGIGGLLSLFRILPALRKTIKVAFSELIGRAAHRENLARTHQDISMRWLILGSIAVILVLWLFPGLPMNFLTICLLVVIGFFFVAVSAITVGIVGSTSNPGSGMTLTTLLITCLVFVLLGWTERVYLISALTMSIVACVAIALSCTTSQDLKTGFLLGATPRLQQLGEIIGLLLPALAVSGTIYLLNIAYTFGSTALPAPQGTLMALIAKGVIHGDIPIVLVFIGVVLGLLFELIKLPILPFAIGLYLPLSLSSGVMVGGIVSALTKRFSSKEDEVTSHDRGVLASSGLVAGDACTGVVIALLTIPGIINPDAKGLLPDSAALMIYLLVGAGLGYLCLKKSAKG